MPTPGFLTSLNDEQREAVLHDDGPLSVLAGPGSGKTRVIIHRIARLVAPTDQEGLDVPPEHVLALAFTIKSADEMRTRLAEMVGVGVAERVRLSTCHAFGRRVVKRFGDRLGYPWETQIADSAQRVRLLRDLMAEHDIFEDRAAEGRASLARHADRQIHRFRIEGLSPDRLSAWVQGRRAFIAGDAHGLDALAVDAERVRLDDFEQLARLFAHFEESCRERGWLTLDQFLTLPVRLLEEREEARAILRDESRHIVVDEFQDWSPVQIRLLERLAPPSERTPPDVCVVGDDDQAIYAFRGADDRSFERFERVYPGHRRIALVNNYRSAPPILAVANRVMQGAAPGERFAPDKQLIACARVDGAPRSVDALLVDDDKHAGIAIAAAIRGELRHRPDMPLSRFAVVARTNTEAERAASALEAAGIAAHVRRSATPWDDPGIQDLFAWLRLLAGQADASDARRVLLRPPVSAHNDTLQRWEEQWRRARREAEQPEWLDWVVLTQAEDPAVARFMALRADLSARIASLPACEALWETAIRLSLTDADGLDAPERSARIASLVTAVGFARSRQPRLAPPGDLSALFEYLADLDEKERAALASPGEDRVEQSEDDALPSDAVVCLTAHQAKGLEFDTVFVPRVRPGWGYPLTQNGSDDEPLPKSLTERAPPEMLAEERRVFYVACTRAQRRLVLLAKSKKARDGKSTDYVLELSGGGVPLIDASGSVAKLIEAAGLALPAADDALDGGGVGFFESEVRRLRRHAAETMVSVPASGFRGDLGRAAAGELERIAEKLRALADLREEAPPSATSNAHEEYRQRQESWARRAGALFRPWPAPLRLSYSTIYDWGACPRCCYLKHVHGLKEPAQSRMQVGHAIHTSMEQFVKEWRAAESEGHAGPTLDRLLAIGRERVAALRLSDAESRDTQHQVRAQLIHAHALHAATPDAHVIHIEAMIDVGYTLDGERHTLVAKLDRVDMLADNRFRVVDYKTGEPNKSKLEPKPDDLQFGVYALVLPALLDPEAPEREIQGERAEDPMPVEADAEYWMLTCGKRGQIAMASLRLSKVRDKINKAVREMRAGQYPKGEHCKGLCAIAPE